MQIAETQREVCSPNPFVGAVLVKDGVVLSTGYTLAYGGDHAEVQAIKHSLADPTGSDLYVTLEPCCHFGRTPPCTDAIIKAGIANVYAGVKDPNELVNGKGFVALKQAGINVEYPFFEEEICEQLEFYLHYITTKRPFVILKNAVSLDGKVAANNGTSRWISNEMSRNYVHQLRHNVDAILTTINTVQLDNPTLNVRLQAVKKQPVRLILDTNLQIDLSSNICQTACNQKTIIFCSKAVGNSAKSDALQQLQIEIIPVDIIQEATLDILQILTILGSRRISSVLIEAGATLATYLLRNRLINKFYCFVCPKIIGGDRNLFSELGIQDISQHIPLEDVKIEVLDDNVLFVGRF